MQESDYSHQFAAGSLEFCPEDLCAFPYCHLVWGTCTTAANLLSCISPSTPEAAWSWLSIHHPRGRKQTSPFTCTSCPQESSHTCSEQDFHSLSQAQIGFGNFLATTVPTRMLLAPGPHSLAAAACMNCDGRTQTRPSSSFITTLTCTHPVCVFFSWCSVLRITFAPSCRD